MSSILQTDYVIVGGGSAGCVLASRLSEDKNVHVVLIESGGYANKERFRIPGAAAFNLGNPKFDWCYQTPPDPTINNRSVDWSAGRVLGGGSSINGLVYIRGIPSDFERWDQSYGGNSGWNYEGILPFFKRAESFLDREADYLGSEGPLSVSSIRDPNVLQEKFLNASAEAGFQQVDLNGSSPEGFGKTDSSQKKGRRASTYEAYLKPHMKRKNLTVLVDTDVTRIIMEDGVATGVELGSTSSNNAPTLVKAGKEVIVCAGAIGSPALLLKSGIGNESALQAAGVDMVHHLAGVGENLQEHVGSGVAKYVNVTTMNSQMSLFSGLKQVWLYYSKRAGGLASPIVEAMGFIKTTAEQQAPDIQLHFLPFGYIIQPESRSAMTAYQPKENAMMITTTLCRPKARGRVSLVAGEKTPIIEHQLLAHQEDRDTLIRGLKIAESLYQQPSLKPHVVSPCTPATTLTSDEQWLEYIQAVSNLAYHFCGTCKMGSDDMAVVDASLNVHGLKNLRVVDASIMPTVTSGNTNATVIAIAEKAVTMIKS